MPKQSGFCRHRGSSLGNDPIEADSKHDFTGELTIPFRFKAKEHLSRTFFRHCPHGRTMDFYFVKALQDLILGNKKLASRPATAVEAPKAISESPIETARARIFLPSRRQSGYSRIKNSLQTLLLGHCRRTRDANENRPPVRSDADQGNRNLNESPRGRATASGDHGRQIAIWGLGNERKADVPRYWKAARLATQW